MLNCVTQDLKKGQRWNESQWFMMESGQAATCISAFFRSILKSSTRLMCQSFFAALVQRQTGGFAKRRSCELPENLDMMADSWRRMFFGAGCKDVQCRILPQFMSWHMCSGFVFHRFPSWKSLRVLLQWSRNAVSSKLSRKIGWLNSHATSGMFTCVSGWLNWTT